MRAVKWERGNIMKWIKACREDKGSPRFMNFGQELFATKHNGGGPSITAVCWGGYNRVPGARTTKFSGIDEIGVNILSDKNAKDWVQLVGLMGSKKSKEELLLRHIDHRTMEVRLACDECTDICETEGICKPGEWKPTSNIKGNWRLFG